MRLAEASTLKENPHIRLDFTCVCGDSLCEHVCSCVCMHTCIGCTQTAVHLHAEVRGHQCLPPSLPTFLRLYLSLAGWPESPGTHLGLHPQHWHYRHMAPLPAFYESWGQELRPLCLHQQALYTPASFSVVFSSFKLTFKRYTQGWRGCSEVKSAR